MGLLHLQETITALYRTGIRILSLGWPGTAWVVLVKCLPGQITEVGSGLQMIRIYSVA